MHLSPGSAIYFDSTKQCANNQLLRIYFNCAFDAEYVAQNFCAAAKI